MATTLGSYLLLAHLEYINRLIESVTTEQLTAILCVTVAVAAVLGAGALRRLHRWWDPFPYRA